MTETIHDPRPLNTVVRENIRAELARRGLKLLHLSELGWGKSSVYRHFDEDGTPFSGDDIQRIADLIGVSTDVLTSRT